MGRYCLNDSLTDFVLLVLAEAFIQAGMSRPIQTRAQTALQLTQEEVARMRDRMLAIQTELAKIQVDLAEVKALVARRAGPIRPSGAIFVGSSASASSSYNDDCWNCGWSKGSRFCKCKPSPSPGDGFRPDSRDPDDSLPAQPSPEPFNAIRWVERDSGMGSYMEAAGGYYKCPNCGREVLSLKQHVHDGQMGDYYTC